LIFDKSFLHFTEYPADAHRGFDIPAAVLVYSSNELYNTLEWSPNLYSNKSISSIIYIYSDELLFAPLATPDFSMPYNVMVMTETAFAYFFGLMLKVLMRRFRELKEGRPLQSDRPIMILYRSIRNLFRI